MAVVGGEGLVGALAPMRYTVLVGDALGRWSPGEVGVREENDFPEKYAIKLRLKGTVTVKLFNEVVHVARVFYFHEDEVLVQDGEFWRASCG